ncbi:MAG: 2-oxoacid:ferredoxin oxidoreductase subunit beta [Actinobacteria bacterium]|nr:2-oxoacid:ferredoxin oxidoreductase subunit beta [Actinomycetota bacterium]
MISEANNRKRNYNLKPADFNTKKRPTWCVGCGNYGIWNSIKKAFVELKLSPHEILIVFGIGCSGNGNNFIKTYAYHALHGMALPVATGAHLANHLLKVIAMTGDGDGVGIGGNHFIHTCRRNLDITHIMHDNRIYGLTTGQTSPTSNTKFKTKSTPFGVMEQPINPVALALICGATFVARGYSGEPEHLKNIFIKALAHKGFSFIDVLQPCVTFNKIDTYDYYKKLIYKLEDSSEYNSGDFSKALQKSQEMERIPLGIFYQIKKRTYHDGLEQIKDKPLVYQDLSSINIESLMKSFY